MILTVEWAQLAADFEWWWTLVSKKQKMKRGIWVDMYNWHSCELCQFLCCITYNVRNIIKTQIIIFLIYAWSTSLWSKEIVVYIIANENKPYLEFHLFIFLCTWKDSCKKLWPISHILYFQIVQILICARTFLFQVFFATHIYKPILKMEI